VRPHQRNTGTRKTRHSSGWCVEVWSPTPGCSVPHDISLVGYNDIPIVSRLPVPLTTVKVPFDHIAEMALQLLNGEQSGTGIIRVVTPSLIPRRSSAAPARG